MHLWNEVIVDTDTAFWIMLIDVVLELLEAQLIPIFEVAVVFCMLLDCVICQMHEGIVNVLEIDAVFRAGRPQVALFEEEKLVVLVEQYPNANVELAFEDEQGPLNILLNDECVVLDLVVVRGLPCG